MELILYKDDIYKVGHTMYSRNGYVAIVIDGNDNSYWFHILLLRNVLKLFGLEYEIIETEEFITKIKRKEVYEEYVYTNLPWSAVDGLDRGKL